MKKRYLIFCLCLWSIIATQAQDQTAPGQDSVEALRPQTPIIVEDEKSFSLKSPRATVRSHLLFLQSDNFQPEMASRTFPKGDYTKKQLEELAVKLIQIYDGKGFYVYLEDIPNEANHLDSLRRSRYAVMPGEPGIYVEKYGDEWLYSKRTLREIPIIHKKVYPYGANLLVNLLPDKVGKASFLGLKLWQYFGILLGIVLAFVVYKLLYEIMALILRKALANFFKRLSFLDIKDVYPVARPLAWFIVALLLIKFVPILQLSIGLSQYVSISLKIFYSIAGVIVAYKLIDLIAVIARHLASRTDTTMDDQLVPLATKIIKWIVVIFGLIFIMQNLGVNVTALLAGVSIGGLALALAAQDTVKNFIGSISIFVDRPFQIGDYIETASFAGTVVEVGVRTTRLRDPGGAQITIPNGVLANMTITNASVRTFRRFVTSLTVTYGTTVAQMEAYVAAVKEIVANHPVAWEEGNIIQFTEMLDSSLSIYLSVYFDTTSFEEFQKCKHSLLLEIIKKAEEMGIDFAFPSTSLYVEQLPQMLDRGSS